jgi:hypothetical protein
MIWDWVSVMTNATANEGAFRCLDRWWKPRWSGEGCWFKLFDAATLRDQPFLTD